MREYKATELERIFWKNGNVSREYVGDENSGFLREYHKNGRLAIETPMKNGLPHGVCKQWNEQGELLGTYEMDMGTGFAKRWHSTGQLQCEYFMISDAGNGRIRTWSETGKLNLEIFLLNKIEVSREEYEKARLSNLALPVYESN